MPTKARVALHFHPDFDLWVRPVLERILEDGAYLSQFATGTSNGGLTAFTGGDRWLWEHRIFDGVYDHVSPADHPIYGALAIDHDPYGPAPRFGSSQSPPPAARREQDNLRLPRQLHAALVVRCRRPAGTDRVVGDPIGPWTRWTTTTSRPTCMVASEFPGMSRPWCSIPRFVNQRSTTWRVPQECGSSGIPGYVLHTDGLSPLTEYRGPSVVAAATALAKDGVIDSSDTRSEHTRWRRGHTDAEVAPALPRSLRPSGTVAAHPGSVIGRGKLSASNETTGSSPRDARMPIHLWRVSLSRGGGPLDAPEATRGPHQYHRRPSGMERGVRLLASSAARYDAIPL